jgi:hypothetical protein
MGDPIFMPLEHSHVQGQSAPLLRGLQIYYCGLSLLWVGDPLKSPSGVTGEQNGDPSGE